MSLRQGPQTQEKGNLLYIFTEVIHSLSFSLELKEQLARPSICQNYSKLYR